MSLCCFICKSLPLLHLTEMGLLLALSILVALWRYRILEKAGRVKKQGDCSTHTPQCYWPPFQMVEHSWSLSSSQNTFWCYKIKFWHVKYRILALAKLSFYRIFGKLCISYWIPFLGTLPAFQLQLTECCKDLSKVSCTGCGSLCYHTF